MFPRFFMEWNFLGGVLTTNFWAFAWINFRLSLIFGENQVFLLSWFMESMMLWYFPSDLQDQCFWIGFIYGTCDFLVLYSYRELYVRFISLCYWSMLKYVFNDGRFRTKSKYFQLFIMLYCWSVLRLSAKCSLAALSCYYAPSPRYCRWILSVL